MGALQQTGDDEHDLMDFFPWVLALLPVGDLSYRNHNLISLTVHTKSHRVFCDADLLAIVKDAEAH